MSQGVRQQACKVPLRHHVSSNRPWMHGLRVLKGIDRLCRSSVLQFFACLQHRTACQTGAKARFADQAPGDCWGTPSSQQTLPATDQAQMQSM